MKADRIQIPGKRNEPTIDDWNINRNVNVKYDLPVANQWINPVRRGWRLACCDCGLVHEMDFMLAPAANGKKILIRFRRNNMATAAKRKRAKRYPKT